MAVPYLRAVSIFVGIYVGLVAVFRPWNPGTNVWWRVAAPLVAGFVVCCWLWRPWALLARNVKGESRRLPLLLVWLVIFAAGFNVYNLLHYRLGKVRDLHAVAELAHPGDVFFFRLRGPSEVSKRFTGRESATGMRKQKGGTQKFYATVYYASPLLASATDTVAQPCAWLSHSFEEELGDNLTPGELGWRYQNFLVYSDARFNSLNLNDFTYLVRADIPDEAYVAAGNSRLPASSSPLLLEAVRVPFSERGLGSFFWAVTLTLGGSILIFLLLLLMPLRRGALTDF